MQYEVDFLPVGEGKSSGDAICLRYSSDNGETWIVGVIDGGTQVTGEKVCTHIKDHYGTETIDFIVSTHPDQDHASGLSVVLEEMTVKKVLMHCPWDYVDHFYDSVTDRRITKESLIQRLKDGHPYAYKIYELANEKNIPIHHAFSDHDDPNISSLHIAGPSILFYLNQVINFRSINEVTEDSTDSTGLLQALREATRTATKWISESWDQEKLVDPEENATSSENNSSIILLFDFAGKKHLFTADAGVPALEEAANKIEEKGFPLKDFTFIQTPHHGSKRNIGPTILNRLVGEPKSSGSATTFTTIVSASKDGEPKHPSRRVTNAFSRRGAIIAATQGNTICHYDNDSYNRGWSKITPVPFYENVEDDE
jgi:beta-lactamase superfamily II metal-dependent hydrolase